jgi:putative transposase
MDVESGPLGNDQTVKRERITEEQIIGLLKKHEPRAGTADAFRKHGISEPTFYNW